WHPIHAGGFHGDRLDATVHKPVRQRLEIRSIRAKGAHDLVIMAVGHTGHDLMRTNVDASGVGGDLAHAFKGTGFALGRAGTMTCTQFAHGGSLDGHARSPWRYSVLIGAQPPVSDACVIENHGAGRDVRHQSMVRSELVIVPR